ncbi:SDR family NAD(P)-dependent oxidoreductase [Lysinibacter cavernae]|uniref:NAD(P)-dependent dehydrogenase (Short-subunit alcohol dehydrogenase family) n=1 Tax=Lysinibacter cavernae TaxID=1640652 RepID=A0A7X5TUX6_9MICO|nr:SDR family oxidoreductase [Lysinibacter cavernae]NIH54112.1 NAD(P)-dependent dehydrogenase (short-subunit alcohol dehydrogenase family) [Lysinibacter cavernae]
MTPSDKDELLVSYGITGKRILITGGSSGIGLATATLAATMGAKVVIVGRDSNRVSNVVTELPGSGHHGLVFDLSDLDNIPKLVKEASAFEGGLDGLVHSAGLHETAPLKALSATRTRALFDVNVTAAMMLAKGFRVRTIEKNDPSLVFLASVAGLVGQPATSQYSATKGAVISLTKSLAIELAREGIRVNAVAPGVVETPMATSLAQQIGSENYDSVVRQHPLGLGTPLEVAHAVLFLMSPAARWITGTSLIIDGGYTAQ